MVETPALIPSQPVRKSTATVALVLGLVGIFIPYVGVILGILAIIFGIIALRNKTTSVAPAIIGIVAGAVAILVTVLVITLLSLFSGHSPFASSDRDRAVTAQINEQKDFTLGETAKIGPIDFTVTKVTPNYQPTADETDSGATPNEIIPDSSLSTYSNVGSSIDEADAEYVVVDATQTDNGKLSLGDYDKQTQSMTLNNVMPIDYSSKGGTLRYVYRIRKTNDSLVMRYDVTIWKSISPIVGTEGAPRQDLTYTIKLK
jgi:hypothetical protein